MKYIVILVGFIVSILILVTCIVYFNNKNNYIKSIQKNNEILDIKKFLQNYQNKEIIYIPNPGNAGDSLIVYGTLQCFDDIKLNYIFGDINKKYNNKILFFGGGGNLVGLYSDCKKFILNNKDNNKIVLLPHTVKDEDELLKNLNNNVIIFCRERISYNYVKNKVKNPDNIYLSKDMAFYIRDLDIYKKQGNGELNCYRTDVEKTNLKIPENNIDLSNALNKTGNTNDPNVVKQVSLSVFDYLSNYDIINTNRLHMAISGSLLGKNVNFYGNSYYKNSSIYDYSLKNNFPKTRFITEQNIPIYIISLKNADKRRDNMRKLLQNHHYSFFDAVNGKNLTQYENSLEKQFIVDGKLNRNQVGCFLSHIVLWDKISKEQEYAFILEDDVNLKINNLDDFINRLYKMADFDLIFTGHCSEKEGKLVGDIDGVKIYESVFPRCTHSYLISKNGARKLLNYFGNNKSILPIDEVIAIAIHKKQIKSYSLFPSIMDQEWQ
jgi:GR25 family glycosyltransferase involved in LPS biosynthesis/exopolysaccharide biosynthesis predicted pyruvyltransferase EpsI